VRHDLNRVAHVLQCSFTLESTSFCLARFASRIPGLLRYTRSRYGFTSNSVLMLSCPDGVLVYGAAVGSSDGKAARALCTSSLYGHALTTHGQILLRRLFEASAGYDRPWASLLPGAQSEQSMRNPRSDQFHSLVKEVNASLPPIERLDPRIVLSVRPLPANRCNARRRSH